MGRNEADAKREQLLELKTRMTQGLEQEFHLRPNSVWFFEDDSGTVEGFKGTDPVMFVGQRPSTGRGGFSRLATGAVGGFYGLLAEYGFKHAHITDVVKESGRAGTPSWQQVERNWPYFQEELEIIRPEVLVALGGWVHWILEHRIEYLVPIERIMHYSFRFIGRAEREKRLREDLARVRRKLDASAAHCCRQSITDADRD